MRRAFRCARSRGEESIDACEKHTRAFSVRDRSETSGSESGSMTRGRTLRYSDYDSTGAVRAILIGGLINFRLDLCVLEEGGHA